MANFRCPKCGGIIDNVIHKCNSCGLVIRNLPHIMDDPPNIPPPGSPPIHEFPDDFDPFKKKKKNFMF